MQRPIHPLVLLAKLPRSRIRGGSRSMDWLLKHHLGRGCDADTTAKGAERLACYLLPRNKSTRVRKGRTPVFRLTWTATISFRYDMGCWMSSEIEREEVCYGVINVTRPATVRLRSNPRQRNGENLCRPHPKAKAKFSPNHGQPSMAVRLET